MTHSADLVIRPAVEADLPALSELCMRSKAVWGYDAAFMEACRDELTLRREELQTTSIAAGVCVGRIVATAQIEIEDAVADLHKLFVDPQSLRSGFGNAMFDWCVAEAKRLGAARMTIEADPDAAPFYERMGAVEVGSAPSGSISGRRLPLFSLDLD